MNVSGDPWELPRELPEPPRRSQRRLEDVQKRSETVVSAPRNSQGLLEAPGKCPERSQKDLEHTASCGSLEKRARNTFPMIFEWCAPMSTPHFDSQTTCQTQCRLVFGRMSARMRDLRKSNKIDSLENLKSIQDCPSQPPELTFGTRAESVKRLRATRGDRGRKYVLHPTGSQPIQ